MKHTSGEWRLSEICPYSIVAGGKLDDRIDIACTDMRHTIKLFTNIPVNEEAISNAKLIAAAPELLEALQTVRNMDTWKKYFGGGSVDKQLEAAIKKATE